MENKLLKNPVYKNNEGYDSFDMSQRVSFSSSVGQLLPVYYDLLSPGDKITINDQMTTRTLTLKSAVMTDLVDVIDYFFIPLEQIYSLFGSFYYGVDDRKSTFVASKSSISRYLPAFDTTALMGDLLSASISDDVGENYLNGCLRLMDCFGISAMNYYKCYTNENGNFNHPLVPIFFAAYQKVYSDFYRLDDFQPNTPENYNLDKYYNNTGLITSGFPVGMFMLRHRPYAKDFFKNVFRSPLIAAGYNDTSDHASSLINTQYMNQVNNWLSGQKEFETVDTGSASSTNNAQGDRTVSINVPSHNGNTWVAARSLNTANFRSMFALEKLLEVTRRAGKSYDLQTLAHWGVKTDTFESDRVYFLGSHESPIVVRDVISTADSQATVSGVTSTSISGDVVGKGYGYSRGKSPIKFTAKKHGILLAIYSCVPKIDYNQLGFDKLHTLMERTDFPIPEFANLGMQPLFGYQANLSDSLTDNSNNRGTEINSDSDIISWANFDVWTYRYLEFKQKYNRTFGSLMFSERRWKPAQTLYSDYLDSNRYNMLIRPTFLNGVLTKNYVNSAAMTSGNIDADMTKLYESDPLLHEFVFDAVKSSKISEYGMPQL